MLTLLSLLVLLQAPQVSPQVLGRYECQGEVPTGAYRMNLTVVQDRDNYYFTWSNAIVQAAKGLGVRVGDHLSVVFVTATNQIGVINYKIGAARLDGTWAMGGGETFTETCGSGRLDSL